MYLSIVYFCAFEGTCEICLSSGVQRFTKICRFVCMLNPECIVSFFVSPSLWLIVASEYVSNSIIGYISFNLVFVFASLSKLSVCELHVRRLMFRHISNEKAKRILDSFKWAKEREREKDKMETHVPRERKRKAAHEVNQ